MLTGLTAGNLYEIRMSTGNSEGISVKSEPVIIYVGVAGEWNLRHLMQASFFY